MSTPSDSPVPGAKLAQEAKLLLDALAERAEPWLNSYAAEREPATGFAGSSGEQAEHSPATCGWCPLCAGLAVIRGERPDLAVRAAEHAAGLLAVLRSALTQPTDPAAEPEAAEPDPDPEGDTGQSPPEPAPRVQRITVRRRQADDPTC